MKNEIEKILAEYTDGTQTLQHATTEVLRLFSISGQSEQLKAFLYEIANDKTYILSDYYKNKAKRLSESL